MENGPVPESIRHGPSSHLALRAFSAFKSTSMAFMIVEP